MKVNQIKGLEGKVTAYEKENSILKCEGNKQCEKVDDIEKEYANKFEEMENELDTVHIVP